MSAVIIRLLAVSACIAAAVGHPYYWVAQANSCTAMPTRGISGHGAPTTDPNTVFTVTGSDGAAVTQVCRGVTYNVEAAFPEPREAVMTATVGSLADGKGDINAECGNRFLTAKSTSDPRVTAAKTTLLIPCSVAASVTETKLAVTSARGSSAAFQQAELAVPIAAAAACTTSPCGGAGNATSPAPATGTAAPAPTPAAPASPPPKNGASTATSLTLVVMVMSAVAAWVC